MEKYQFQCDEDKELIQNASTAKFDACGKIVSGNSANLTIAFKAAGWNGKTVKLTVSASKGTVTEGQTTIASEASMSGTKPSMTGTIYTFHVTGADKTTKITFDTTCSMGIDDLVIIQTK